MFRFEYDMDDKMYVELSGDLNLYGESRRKLRMLTKALTCAMFLVGISIAAFGVGFNLFAFILSLVILSVIALLGVTVLFKPYTTSAVKLTVWIANKQGGAPYDTHTSITIDDGGVTYVSAAQETKTGWGAIKCADVCGRAVYLCLDGMRTYILPFACFADEGEKARFLEYIKSMGVKVN